MTRTTRTSRRLLVLLCGLTAGALLLTGTEALARKPLRHTLLAYAKAGGLFDTGDLGPGPLARLGVGYVPPVLKGRLGAVLDLGYSQASLGETLSDPRLGTSGGEYSYDLTQRELSLFLGPQVLPLGATRRLIPYAAVGLELHFIKSTVNGSAGDAAFGENSETSTEAGLGVQAGAGYRLGPGMITAELTFGWAPVDHGITGDSNLIRIGALVGYTALIQVK